MQFLQNCAIAQIVLTNKSPSGVAMQGSKNFGRWAGRKWRQRGEMGGKNSPTRAKSGVFVPKILFFAEILFLEHTLSEEIILTEVRLVGSPIIDVALALWNI